MLVDLHATMAAELAGRLGLPGCGGSDAHDTSGIGRCLTEIPGATSAEEVIEGIVAAAARPVLGAAWASANGADYQRADLAPYR